MTTTLTGHQIHKELLDQLGAIDQWWPDASQPTVSAMNAREVLVRLTELRDTLKDHFANEEEHGLLPDNDANAPRLETKADQLQKQHEELLQRLSTVIMTVPVTNENPSAWSAAKGHFEDFRKQLERHEREEIDLVQTASGVNLGVGD